jgi:hypothetical protein
MGSGEFAAALGISERAARKHLTRSKWRGHALPVTQVPAQTGGKGGVVLALRLDACPPALLDEMGLSLPEIEAPVEAAFKGSFMLWQFERQAEKLDAIGPILATAKKSAERVAAYAAAAAQPRIIRGQVTFYAEKTLREWVSLYESGGPAALMPRARGGRGHARVLITRAWDAGIDLAEDQKAKVAAQLDIIACSYIANDGISDLKVIDQSQRKLIKLSVKAGSNLDKRSLERLCKLNGRWVLKFKSYRDLHSKNKDHKKYQDDKVPRIRRELHPVPMGLVYGDVHYVDLLVEEGGAPVRVRLIAWMDAASHFLWATPVFLAPGGGFTQADVTESLLQLCMSKHGGIPLEAYLDNGSEYKELVKAMARLAMLSDMPFKVTVAKPYSPTSKGPIEGAFHILEGILKSLDGYIGGDRTNKKSANKGRVVAPYRKGLDALKSDLQAAIAIYNDTPQKGRLKGLSPVQMLQKKIAETGFVARNPSLEAFDMMFNKVDARTIQAGGHITIDKVLYYGPCLQSLSRGDRVDVLIPSRAGAGRVFIRQGGRDLGWASEMRSYASGDRQGARDQYAMERSLGQTIDALAAHVDPSVRYFDDRKAAIGQFAPNAPEPEHWGVASLGVIDKTAQLSPAQLEAEADAKARKDLEYFLGGNPQEKREVNGGNR